MVNGRDKGARGERELSDELSRLFGLSTRRGQQFCGIEGEDVVGFPGVHVECKRVERLQIYDAVKQSVRDSERSQKVPAVFHRKNREPWLVTVRLEDLLKLAQAVLTATSTEKDSSQ